MNEEREIRSMPVSMRLTGDNPANSGTLYGRAVIYNSFSLDLGDYTEVIEPGFFSKEVLRGDVIATVHNNQAKLVGRTSAGTLELTDTPEALLTKNNLPATTSGKDLKISVKRGEIRGMSFAFKVKSGGDKWERDVNNRVIRRLLPGGCEKLYEVSYVSDPAYQDTSIALRSLKQFISTTPPHRDYKAILKELKLSMIAHGE